MKLIIIESPNKIHSFQAAVGKDYEIISSVGHCVDLPKKSFAVDIKNNFEPTFEVISEKKNIVDDIRKKAKKATHIYFMTDIDREGVGIFVLLYNEIKNDTKATILRAETSEITKKGILDGIKNAFPIEKVMGKYNAFLARRIADRVCGYKSSWPVQVATGGRSAGRVQSAVLRVIVDREKEILNFKPEEYWIITAYLLSKQKEPFFATLSDTIKVNSQKEAEKIYNLVKTGTPTVFDIEKKEVDVKAYAPFTTLPLIASASSVYGWGAEKTMKVAQDIFSAGLISYHRTDCVFTPADVLSSVRSFIASSYGAKYYPDKPNYYTSKKGAQEAHSCIYPTDVNNIHPNITGDELKLYTLVWKRFVASQMNAGRDEKIKVITKISNYDFISRGSRILFDGFRKCWDFGSSEDVILPELKKGDICTFGKSPKKQYEKESIATFDGLVAEQKFTSPPSRYSDASLSKKCENEQIARPATFGNFIKLLQDRGYIIRKNKSFTPTELGIKVIDFLVASDMCFVNLKFTANLEEKLDAIQEEKIDKVEVLKEFWERLKSDLDKAKTIKSQNEVTGYKCPKCNGNLLKKHSSYGEFYSCSNYKKPKKVKGKEVPQEDSCSYTATVGPDNQPIEKNIKTLDESKYKCKNCGQLLLIRKGKKGNYLGCRNWNKDKKCLGFYDQNGNSIVFKKYKKH